MISYSHEDRPFVDKLADALRRNQCEVWFDERIGPGEDYSRSIQTKISDASAVLVVWSKGACTSDWVRAELLRAFNLKKPLFPVIKEPCDSLPVPFNLYQC